MTIRKRERNVMEGKKYDPMVGEDIIALIERGNVTDEEVQRLHCNSWEWSALTPALTDEALIRRVEHAISNSRPKRNVPGTYDEAICHLYAPELIRRIKLKTFDPCIDVHASGLACRHKSHGPEIEHESLFAFEGDLECFHWNDNGELFRLNANTGQFEHFPHFEGMFVVVDVASVLSVSWLLSKKQDEPQAEHLHLAAKRVHGKLA